MPDDFDRTDNYGAAIPGPIQRLEPALEPLTKGLAPGAPVRKKTASECADARTGRPGILQGRRCPLCGAQPSELCKL